MSTRGDLLVAEATRYVGTVERPWASNLGQPIEQWQQDSATKRLMSQSVYRAAPWCAIFVDHCADELGLNLPQAITHPFTGYMYAEAKRLGWLRDHRKHWPAGSIFCFAGPAGKHTGIVERDLGNGTVETIEGNFNHGVRLGLRRKSDWVAIVPPSILENVGPSTKRVEVYWFEDVDQTPETYGPWRLKASRDKSLAKHRRETGADSGRYRLFTLNGGYAFQVLDSDDSLQFAQYKPDGSPWLSRADRDGFMAAYAKRTGHRVRPRSKFITVNVPSMGDKTINQGPRETGGAVT